ncbi:MAG: NHL repeat-containing protein [Candidatus Eisenbacteria bacterium]|nr:NHL repeat-containing protein [Candidatus Eisenbacteria bacterium]
MSLAHCIPLLAALAAAAPLPAALPDSLPLQLIARDTLGSGNGGRTAAVEPSGVAADAFGRIYVTDAALHRLERFDAQGRWLGESGALGSAPGQLHRPAGVVPYGTLGVAVLDRENLRVVSYDLYGRLLGVAVDLADAALTDRTGRVDPVALSSDRGGALFIADAERDRILAFDFSGRLVRELGGYGARAGSFRGLAGVASAPRGELVTAERVGARVQRLDAGGRVAAAWPLDVKPGRGRLPVAVDDSARVAVADEATGRLWVFDPAGRTLAWLSGLGGPRALAFAPDGTLLVAEAAAGRVRRFTLVPAAARGE